MWKECQRKEKSQEFINGSHLPLDQRKTEKQMGRWRENGFTENED